MRSARAEGLMQNLTYQIFLLVAEIPRKRTSCFTQSRKYDLPQCNSVHVSTLSSQCVLQTEKVGKA